MKTQSCQKRSLTPRRRHSAEHNLRVRLHHGEGDVLTITLEEEIRLHRIIGGIVHVLTKTARQKSNVIAIQDLKMKTISVPPATPIMHSEATKIETTVCGDHSSNGADLPYTSV